MTHYFNKSLTLIKPVEIKKDASIAFLLSVTANENIEVAKSQRLILAILD